MPPSWDGLSRTSPHQGLAVMFLLQFLIFCPRVSPTQPWRIVGPEHHTRHTAALLDGWGWEFRLLYHSVPGCWWQTPRFACGWELALTAAPWPDPWSQIPVQPLWGCWPPAFWPCFDRGCHRSAAAQWLVITPLFLDQTIIFSFLFRVSGWTAVASIAILGFSFRLPLEYSGHIDQRLPRSLLSLGGHTNRPIWFTVYVFP